MPYQFVTSVNRYRDTDTGQFVPRERIFAYVEEITQAGRERSDVLAELTGRGVLSPRDFEKEMRLELKTTMIQEYLLGRGGRDQMTSRDWGSTGQMLRKQYRQLSRFVEDIEEGKLSTAQIRARAEQYFDATREAYERGRASAHGIIGRLPSYPGDDHQTCHGECHCTYDYEQVFDTDGTLVAVLAYWRLDPLVEEHCSPTATTRSCEQNAAEYNPLVIEVTS